MDETTLNHALERFLAVLRGTQVMCHPGLPPRVTTTPHEHYWRVCINNSEVYCFVIRTHHDHWQPGDILAPPTFGRNYPADHVGSIFGDFWPNPPPTNYSTNFCGPKHIGERAHPNPLNDAFASLLSPSTPGPKPSGGPKPGPTWKNTTFPRHGHPPGNRKSPALHGFEHMLLNAQLKADCPNGIDEIRWLDEID